MVKASRSAPAFLVDSAAAFLAALLPPPPPPSLSLRSSRRRSISWYCDRMSSGPKLSPPLLPPPLPPRLPRPPAGGGTPVRLPARVGEVGVGVVGVSFSSPSSSSLSNEMSIFLSPRLLVLLLLCGAPTSASAPTFLAGPALSTRALSSSADVALTDVGDDALPSPPTAATATSPAGGGATGMDLVVPGGGGAAGLVALDSLRTAASSFWSWISASIFFTFFATNSSSGASSAACRASESASARRPSPTSAAERRS
mmetsp:Transcript_100901/g.289648  ORF Transcript_100901/g.289648 Transcript_100901/m.289648 type:complete len:256 (-) Transcript_100901:381-1148(-)